MRVCQGGKDPLTTAPLRVRVLDAKGATGNGQPADQSGPGALVLSSGGSGCSSVGPLPDRRNTFAG